ncbi:PTS sugar transporter subunit IIA [candidate division KSB1 bacterium]
MINCIILTHGDLGQSLLSTTEKIIGECPGIKIISNEQTSLKDLIVILEEAVTEWNENEVVIMVDFCGGSCWHAARVVKRDKAHVALISGVNLPVMLAFISKRDSYKLPEFIDYLRESQIKGIVTVHGLEPDPEDNDELL